MDRDFPVSTGGTASVIRGTLIDKDLCLKYGNIPVAVKAMKLAIPSQEFLSCFFYEVAIMSKLPISPYLAHMIGYSDNPHCIIMKFYPMTLSEIMDDPKFKSHPTRDLIVRKIALDIATGMDEIHQLDIMHFDLKPGMNCLKWH